MTATIDLTETASRPVDPNRPTLSDAAAITTFGHLAWLAWVWLTITIVYAGVIAAIARFGTVDESMWQSVVAGWQRWVVFAAGITTTTTFLRMLVRNGATRALLSSASTVTMAVIGVVAGLWITAGFAVEKLVYDRFGWTQEVDGGTVLQWSDLWRVALESPLVLAAYFVAGWLVGVGFYRFGVVGGIVLLLPSMIPAALCELVASEDVGGVGAATSWLDQPHLAITVAVGAAAIAAGVWAARRITRDTPVR